MSPKKAPENELRSLLWLNEYEVDCSTQIKEVSEILRNNSF